MDVGDEQVARPGWSWAGAVPFALLLLGCAACALYALVMAPLLYPFMGDASAYIEAARSLLAGQPLVISVPFGYDNETQIFRLWPPGFPVLIALVASFGIEAAEASLWLTRFAVAVLPFTAYWAIYPAVGRPVAIVGALLCGSAFGLLQDAHLMSSDAPFALAVSAAVGLFLRGVDESEVGRSSRLLIVAGLTSALAITIRNGGIALALTEGATLATLWIAREASFETTVRRAVSTALGGACGLAPLLVWNLRMFGEFMPYDLPPSTVGVAQNVTDLMTAVVRDFLPILPLSGTPTTVIFVLVAISACVLTARALLRVHKVGSLCFEMSDDSRQARRRCVFLTFAMGYSAISAVMLVVARSRYEWGEFISWRHVAQFDWLLATALIAAIGWRLSSPRALAAVLIAVVTSVLALRVWHVADFHQRMVQARDTGRPFHSHVVHHAFAASASAADLVHRVPAHCDIISNAAIILLSTHRRHAWMVWEDTLRMEDFTRLRKPSVLIFIPTPDTDIRKLEPPSPGYRTIRDPDFVAFVNDACQPSP